MYWMMMNEEERELWEEQSLIIEDEPKEEYDDAPNGAEDVVEWYLSGRTFPMQYYDSYCKAVCAMFDLSERLIRYDGEVCVAGYDKEGNLIVKKADWTN